MRIPLSRVQKVDLLDTWLGSAIAGIEKGHLARLGRVLGSLVTEVQVDGAVKSLNLVLDEQAHFDVAILKEFVHLLADNLPVVSIHFFAHFDEA